MLVLLTCARKTAVLLSDDYFRLGVILVNLTIAQTNP